MATRDLTFMDVEEIVGGDYMATRLVDVEGVNCDTCGALVAADWSARLKHANWHISKGDVTL